MKKWLVKLLMPSGKTLAGCAVAMGLTALKSFFK